MRRSHLIVWLCLLCAGPLATSARAQIRGREPLIPGFEELAPTFIKVGQSGFVFLALPTNARTAAMADAGVGVVGRASGLFTNPATLAFMEGREAFFTHVEWIAGMKHDVGGVAFEIPGRGTFGVGFMSFDAGTFHRTEIDPDPASAGFKDLGTFKTTNLAASFGYGFKITDRFSVGGAVKLAHQNLGMGSIFLGGRQQRVENTKTAAAVDLGTYFNTGFRNMVMAMSVQNFSQELVYQQEQFELPRNIRLGLLLDLVSLWGRTPVPHHLGLAVDLVNPIDFDERALFGLEYSYRRPGSPVGIALRGGYKVNHDTEDFSVGGGFAYRTEAGRGVAIDYAFKHFDGNFFDSVQLVTGSVSF